MTYDNADEVKAMARAHGFQMRLIPMKNTHHAAMEELVIGKNLSWMDRYPAVHEPLVEYRVDSKKKGSFDKLLKTDVAILPPRRLV
jgi:DNA adenine methylase